jgi:hypothetical protein
MDFLLLNNKIYTNKRRKSAFKNCHFNATRQNGFIFFVDKIFAILPETMGF